MNSAEKQILQFAIRFLNSNIGELLETNEGDIFMNYPILASMTDDAIEELTQLLAGTGLTVGGE